MRIESVLVITVTSFSGSITTSTEITYDGQASIVSERYKATTAARLAFHVSFTERSVTSVDVSPDGTVRLTVVQFETLQSVCLFLMLVEGSVIRCMITGRSGHTELLIFFPNYINTFGRTSVLRHPLRVDMSQLVAV